MPSKKYNTALPSERLFGWIRDEEQSEAALAEMPHPEFKEAAPKTMKGTGEGKTILLFKALEKVTNKKMPVFKQEIGDCVSFGGGIVTDLLACIEIMNGDAEEFIAHTATEVCYNFMRHEIGKDRIGREDGGLGTWMGNALVKCGTVRRGKYGNVNLTKYSGATAKKFGAPGFELPRDIQDHGLDHLIQTASLITSFNQLRDAYANGYPAFVCSMQGFEGANGGRPKKDKDGFLKPRGQWPHCMPIIGVKDDERPGALIYNQWDDWVDGPCPYDEPICSFWADAEVVDDMLRGRDSMVVSGLNGYRVQPMPEFWLS
jgi:hypothetical protein